MSFVAWQVPAVLNVFEAATMGTTNVTSYVTSATFESLSQSSNATASETQQTTRSESETAADMTTRDEATGPRSAATSLTLQNSYDTRGNVTSSTSRRLADFTSTQSRGGAYTVLQLGTTVINAHSTREGISITDYGSTALTVSYQTLGTESVVWGQTSSTSTTSGSSTFGPNSYTGTYTETTSSTRTESQPTSVETWTTASASRDFYTTSSATETLTTVRATTVAGALSSTSTTTTRVSPDSSSASTSDIAWVVGTSASTHDSAMIFVTLAQWDCAGVSTTTPAPAGSSCGAVWSSLSVTSISLAPLTATASESANAETSSSASASTIESASAAGTRATTSSARTQTTASSSSNTFAAASTYLAGSLGAAPLGSIGSFTLYEAYITATATTTLRIGTSTLTGTATTGTGTSSRLAASGGAAHGSRSHTLLLEPGCYAATLIGSTNTTTTSWQITGTASTSTTLPPGSAALLSALCYATAASSDILRYAGSVLTTSAGCQVTIDP